MQKTFYAWLKKQEGRNDPVGDLTHDAIRAKDFPQGYAEKKEIKEYLLLKGACPQAIDAFNSAWAEYKKFIK